MIILDTNVLSEALRPEPSGQVLRWLAAQEPSAVYLTAIALAEVLYAIELLPAGKRGAHLSAAVDKVFEEFSGRILSFDEDAGRLFPAIVAARDSSGRPISQSDAMIAAIARSHRATVATRNTRDFEGCGLRLLNPWTP